VSNEELFLIDFRELLRKHFVEVSIGFSVEKDIMGPRTVTYDPEFLGPDFLFTLDLAGLEKLNG
jgi:hypothetical protein